MSKAEREKGKRGEREFAGLCREHGYTARRGQQYSGANGDADVVGLPDIHVEVKRVERLDLLGAMAQSKADAKAGEMPIVAHRRNNAEWLITMAAEDWFALYDEYYSGRELKAAEEVILDYLNNEEVKR
ncbi:MAG: hypothetical protein Q4C00_05475 [Bacillota bacterium]|nr:hypothetical protein [Bacillota bacterium]